MEDVMVAWGKTGADGAWHPVVHHGVDAAAVVAVLWTRMLPAALRLKVAQGLGVEPEAALSWVRLLAWLHDAGKVTAPFQRLDDGQAARVRAAGWDLSGGRFVAHGRVSAFVIERALAGLGARWDRQALACAAGGHHGSFAAAENPLDALEDKRDALGALAVARAGSLPPVGEVSNPVLAIVAGLVTLADWIASNPQWFPLSGGCGSLPTLMELGTYEELAAERAALAWRALGWSGPRGRPGSDRLHILFPFIEIPSPMQSTAANVADRVDEPALCVIEDRTGSGKTEAALVLADAFIGSGLVRGAFIGLPTRATADQAYDRVVAAFSAGADKDELVRIELVHGFASLTPAYRGLAGEEPRPADIARDDERRGSASEQVVAGGWFSQRKRGLLAPIAVGTIDQSMLAALQSRHFTLRMLGLAGKVVVLDEVHAYDVYMGVIVQRLVEWLAALGCPVVLLSATLPMGAREDLLAAYARGRATSTGESRADLPYPRFTMLSGGERHDRAVPTELDRITRAELVDEDRDRVVADVVALARDGLEVVVIANTVARSRDWYRLFKRFAGDVPVELLHARFRLLDRAAIEQRIIERYSREGTRPGGSIVVATQVLEQSLDLDFDLVVSELAPIDLLLQRAGRSHRHRRDRSAAAGSGPWLQVLVPPRDEDGLPMFDHRGAAGVYAEHVLLRSFVVLRDHLAVSGDSVVERRDRSDVDHLVQRVYGEEDVGVDSTRWKSSKAALERDRHKQHEHAVTRIVDAPGSEHLITDRTGEVFDEEDPRAPLPPKTRLGDDPVRVLLLDPHERAELERRLPAQLDHVPPSTVRWLQMRTASLPGWHFRAADLTTGVDDLLALRAPELAWVRPIHLDEAGRGQLVNRPVASDPVLGVLVGPELEEALDGE